MVLFYEWINIPEYVKRIAIPNTVTIHANKRNKYIVFDDDPNLIVAKLIKSQNLEYVFELLSNKIIHNYGDYKFVYDPWFIVLEKVKEDGAEWRVTKIFENISDTDYVLSRLYFKELNIVNSVLTFDNIEYWQIHSGYIYLISKVNGKNPIIHYSLLHINDKEMYKRTCDIIVYPHIYKDYTTKYHIMNDKTHRHYYK